MKILFIAPMQKAQRKNPTFLAASKKIFFLLELLHSSGFELFLINSAPDMDNFNSERVAEVELDGGAIIPCLHPASSKFRKLGRLKHIFQVHSLVDKASQIWGRPDLVWCYNGYAFEMRAARYARLKYNARVILEFEDWIFARGSALNPKALLDWIFWRRAAKQIDFCFAVNAQLQKRMSAWSAPTFLLPGIVHSSIAELRISSPPFSINRDKFFVGYFGGLQIEKGASFLLGLIRLAQERASPVHFVITGGGELEHQFSQLQSEFPDYLTYMGKVNQIQLCNAIAMVDIILNPHTPNQGIFPFKVVEAVSTGRLLITTDLNMEKENLSWLSSAVIFEQLDQEKWLKTILKGESLYISKQGKIVNASNIATVEYSVEELKKKIEKIVRTVAKKRLNNS